MQDDEVHEATEFPIKTDHLVKGSVIAVDVIEAAFGNKRETQRYQLDLMSVQDYVERRFADRGEVVFVIQEKGALRILTDEEAPAYAAKLFREGIRRAGRAHRRQLGADRSQMSDPTRVTHDRQLEVQGRMLAAAAKERRSIAPSPSERQTPGRLKPA